MPLYRYTATDIGGKTKRGKLEAADIDALKAALAARQLYLLSAGESEDDLKRKMKSGELAEFCRQISVMLKAGVSLIRAVGIMLEGELKPGVRSACKSIQVSLTRGIPLSEAMEEYGMFPPLLINVIRASESSGRMDQAALRMAGHYEKEHRMNGKVRNAMFYPIFLLCLTVVIIIVIFSFVLPSFFTLFDGVELPALTRIVIGISNTFTKHWMLIVICLVMLIAALRALFAVKGVRIWADRLLLRLPRIGKLLRIIYTARFARTLSSLYSSGLTILNALQNTRDTVGNAYISEQFDEVIASVRNGESLSVAIGKVDGFDKRLSSTIRVGEETGNLDYMLDSMADAFDYDSEQALARLIALIEPIMIIIMALIVLTIIVAVMLPIMSLYNSIGSGYSY